MEEYKVLITTSGVGSRLGELTQYTNKGLVRIGKKPAISYIVENYPKDITIVVTLGYYGDQVKDFLELAYPDRLFEFVKIENYDGPGSSLVYSILQSEKNLQCPFIYHACDTLVFQPVPTPHCNWVGGFKKKDGASNFRTIVKTGDTFLKFNEKGVTGCDDIYIGLSGIKDYESFWENAWKVYKDSPLEKQLSDCHVINNMSSSINKRSDFTCKDFETWMDIGNIDGLTTARAVIDDKFDILDKVDESIFIYDDYVIKFFYDKQIIKKRVLRGKYLGLSCPKIIDQRDNFYKYEYVKGDVFSKRITLSRFSQLLEWAREFLWKRMDFKGDFSKVCYDFYIDKTVSRICKYFKETGQSADTVQKINGLIIPPIGDLMSRVDLNWLCASDPCTIHGDFILENIMYTEDGFKLIDWRQDFGGVLECGDIYYDLAKLNHNLIFSHDIIYRDLFYVKEKSLTEIECDILRSNLLCECQNILFDFIEKNGYDLKKVKILTPIIWLNMAPLHSYPINRFLFYFGKYTLNKELQYV